MIGGVSKRLRSSLIKDGGKVVAATFIVVLLLEISFRFIGFFWHGFSAYYLFYGFHNLVGRVGISPWQTHLGGYYKFPPNYVLQGAAGQAAETASINSLGFRGPEFQPVKPKGVFRIVCMGESSTFGFHNSDTGTYPIQLQRLFEKDNTGKPLRIEVINAGFPYYNTGSIVALLENEIIKYQPDVVTLYSGYNDAYWPLEVGALSTGLFWFQNHSVMYLFLKETLLTDRMIYRIRAQVWKVLPPKFEEAQAQATLARIASRYRQNVQKMIELSKTNNFRLVFIKQPMTTAYSNPDYKKYAAYSYQQEYDAIVTTFRERGYLETFSLILITHHRLVDELEALAKENNIPIVDNIAIVDQDRRRLASPVHLTEEANLRLAEALKARTKALLPDESQRNAIDGRLTTHVTGVR